MAIEEVQDTQIYRQLAHMGNPLVITHVQVGQQIARHGLGMQGIRITAAHILQRGRNTEPAIFV